MLMGSCLNGDDDIIRRINQEEPYQYLNCLILASNNEFSKSINRFTFAYGIP